MSTPADVLALAEQLRAKARDLRAEADKLDDAAALLDGQAGAAIDDAERRGLTIAHERSKVSRDMQPREYEKHRARLGRPVETDHPFAKALSDRRISVRQWAEAHKLTRAKVASWMVEGEGARRIPRKYADEIAKDFKVPTSAWRNGIRED